MRPLLIVPAYNEAGNILTVVRTIESAGYDYIVINDGSSDNTKLICEANGINSIHLAKNLGIGGAVQTGHLYARENGYDIDIQFDGDGQHDIAYIPCLLDAIEGGADLAIGSRFIEPSTGFQSTRARRAGIKWLQKWIRLFTGLNITDATSGFRACDKKAIDLFCSYYPSDYPEPESIVYARHAGLALAEVPVSMKERQGGTSSIGFVSGIYYMIKVSMSIAIVGFSRKPQGGID